MRLRNTSASAWHPNVGVALKNLVGLYEVLGRHADADVLRKRMLEVTNTLYRGRPNTPYRVR